MGIRNEDKILKFYSQENPCNVSHSVVNLRNTTTYFEAQVNKLSTLMSKFDHKHIDLLKFDIEGAEYEVIKSQVSEKVFPKVVCIVYEEVFNPIDSNYKVRIQDSQNLLIDKGYNIYHLDYTENYTLVRNQNYKIRKK